jgi:sterol desaturase/sphingolipid hydroxylase (fatty acid hydroxylase superfamily)
MSIRQRMGVFCIRVAGILLGAAFLWWLPDFQTNGILRVKNVLISFVTVIMVGVALYDTFFYNRSRW